MSVRERATVTPYSDGTGGGSNRMVFHGWSGWIPSLQNQVDEFQRLGQIGSGAQITGKRGRKKSIWCWTAFAAEAEAETWCGMWEALEGRIVAVVDGFGRAMPRVRLTGLVADLKCGRGPRTGGTTQALYRVECTADAERLPDA